MPPSVSLSLSAGTASVLGGARGEGEQEVRSKGRQHAGMQGDGKYVGEGRQEVSLTSYHHFFSIFVVTSLLCSLLQRAVFLLFHFLS